MLFVRVEYSSRLFSKASRLFRIVGKLQATRNRHVARNSKIESLVENSKPIARNAVLECYIYSENGKTNDLMANKARSTSRQMQQYASHAERLNRYRNGKTEYENQVFFRHQRGISDADMDSRMSLYALELHQDVRKYHGVVTGYRLVVIQQLFLIRFLYD